MGQCLSGKMLVILGGIEFRVLCVGGGGTGGGEGVVCHF